MALPSFTVDTNFQKFQKNFSETLDRVLLAPVVNRALFFKAIILIFVHCAEMYMENPNHPRQQLLSLYYGPFDQENSWIKRRRRDLIGLHCTDGGR